MSSLQLIYLNNSSVYCEVMAQYQAWQVWNKFECDFLRYNFNEWNNVIFVTWFATASLSLASSLSTVTMHSVCQWHTCCFSLWLQKKKRKNRLTMGRYSMMTTFFHADGQTSWGLQPHRLLTTSHVFIFATPRSEVYTSLYLLHYLILAKAIAFVVVAVVVMTFVIITLSMWKQVYNVHFNPIH